MSQPSSKGPPLAYNMQNISCIQGRLVYICSAYDQNNQQSIIWTSTYKAEDLLSPTWQVFISSRFHCNYSLSHHNLKLQSVFVFYVFKDGIQIVMAITSAWVNMSAQSLQLIFCTAGKHKFWLINLSILMLKLIETVNEMQWKRFVRCHIKGLTKIDDILM
jgi:hypothetical protein